MKALELLKSQKVRKTFNNQELDEAIKELVAIKENINTSIEEIEYALAKTEYASNYLNNALRFLKEKV